MVNIFVFIAHLIDLGDMVELLVYPYLIQVNYLTYTNRLTAQKKSLNQTKCSFQVMSDKNYNDNIHKIKPSALWLHCRRQHCRQMNYSDAVVPQLT